MNYDEVLNFMYESLPMYQRIGPAAYKADLETTLELDMHFGHSHKQFKSIHIAGTNGKGSVSHSLASILQESGYITGLYTSPHLVDYRERIRVNGEKISKDFVLEFINNNIDFFTELKPSFFEMSVALAFEYFKYKKVDVAVVEVGMGGRLDSTNIINPVLSIITNIGYDHTRFLGDTLAKIAYEKAGIIKKEVPVIIGEYNSITADVFNKVALAQNSNIIFADKQSSCEQIISDFSNSKYLFKKNGVEKTYNFALGGEYQSKNLNLIINAVETLRNLNFDISDENLQKGLQNLIKNTELRGRWEKISDLPLTVCDTGHNADGLKWVVNQIKSLPQQRKHIILGFANDKNVDDLIKLFPTEESYYYYFTQASVPRAMKIDELSRILSLKFSGNYKLLPDVKTAYLNAKFEANFDDLIFIGGSTFIVADLLLFIFNHDITTLQSVG